MRQFCAVLLCSILATGLTGCLKAKMTMNVKNDATGAMTMGMTMKTEALESLKGMMESMGDMGGAEMEQAEEAFDEMEQMFDEKKVAQMFKDQGMDVTKATKVDEDGWKGFELEASMKDVNVYIQKAAAEQKKQVESMDVPFSPDVPLTPTFYKTSDPKVGQLVLLAPIAELLGDDIPIDLEELEDLGDEELEAMEMYLDTFKSMLSVDEMKFEFVINLPGKVQETKGCKKSGENGMKVSFSGGDISADNLVDMMGFKDGISCTFEIPEDCKIVFQDRKAKGKSNSNSEATPDKAKEKKGGLKIGGKNG